MGQTFFSNDILAVNLDIFTILVLLGGNTVRKLYPLPVCIIRIFCHKRRHNLILILERKDFRSVCNKVNLDMAIRKGQGYLVVVSGLIGCCLVNRSCLHILLKVTGTAKYSYPEVLYLRLVCHYLGIDDRLRKVNRKYDINLVRCIRLHSYLIIPHTGCEAEQNQEYIYKLFHNPRLKSGFISGPSIISHNLIRTPIPLIIYTTRYYMIITIICNIEFSSVRKVSTLN